MKIMYVIDQSDRRAHAAEINVSLLSSEVRTEGIISLSS
jgi:hypothetical protein